jgi:hypothetical protein
MPPRKRLGQLLTELKVIDDHQLQSALGHQRQWGGKLGAILVQKGFCGEEQLVSALAQHLNMERVKLGETKIDPRAVKLVSKQIAEKLHVFPYHVSGAGRSEVISIAMSDPTDLSAVDQLAFHTGKRIKPLLASDGEIVSAIQANYGATEVKKEATDKVARPPGSPAAAAGAAAVAGFPKRIEPQPAGVAAPPAPRPSPFAPPTPVPPAKPASPPQKTEQAPHAEAAAAAPPVPLAPVAVDLPEDDADDMGLEPIAAHSQFGDVVAGQEEVAGEGSAADTIEGLVSASLAHEGAEQAGNASDLKPTAEGAPSQATGGATWDEPARDVLADAAPAEAGWPQLERAAPEEQGWGTPLKTDEASWAVAQPAGEVPSAWPSSTPGDGWSMEEPSTSAGWSTAEGGQPWSAEGGAAAEEEPPSEALPTDAILGAVQEFGEDPEESGGAGWDAEEPPADVAAAEQAAPQPEPEALEAQAEAPPEPQAEVAPEPQEEAPPELREEAAPEPQFEPAPELQAEAPAELQFEAAPEPQAEAPAELQLEPPAPQEELFAAGIDDVPDALVEKALELSAEAADEPSGPAREPDTEPIPERPAYAVAAEQHEAEPPDAWGAIDDPLAAEAAPEVASSMGAAPAAGEDLSTQEFADPLLSGEAADGQASAAPEPDAQSASLEVEISTSEAEESAAAGQPSLDADAPQWQPGAEETPATAEAAIEHESTERFARQDAGWIGEALEGATPLSPADLGTLASIGIEPSDGVGALRLLATLIRILNRSQLIEPDELRAEIRESREVAAAIAAQAPNGVESEGSSPAEAEPPGTPAET